MWLIAAGLAMLVPAGTTAQKAERSAANAAELLKSQQIQADLQAIESDRASAVNNLVASWERVADPNVYDLRNELGPVLERTPAWQLYGASQVSDFRRLTRWCQPTWRDQQSARLHADRTVPRRGHSYPRTSAHRTNGGQHPA